jgi:hypothetical protein
MPIPLGVLAVAGAGAAGGGAAFDLLETTLISSNTASVSFSSLGSYSAYRHLQVRYTARNSVTTSGAITMTINSDTGSNYAYHYLSGSNSAVTTFATSSQTSLRSGQIIPSDGVTSNFGPSLIEILDFGNTNKKKTLRFFNGVHDAVGASNIIELTSGLWNSTSAITSFTFTPPGGGNFVSGSRFSLYGIKG